MITQIYTIKALWEAEDVIRAGANYIGTVPAQVTSNKYCTDHELVKEIYALAKDRAKVVCIALTNDPDEMIELTKKLNPDILHVCANEYRADKAFADRLHTECPGVELMQAVQVDGDGAIEKSLEYDEFCDYIILDSGLSTDKGIGASGMTHDWNISEEIVKRCKAKIILAGGLGPENVEAAIRKVKPFGVDSLTKTNGLELENGLKYKNIARVKDFCEIAQRVAEELGL